MAKDGAISIYRPPEAEIRRANQVRERILENVAAQQRSDAQSERRMMQIGNDARLVQSRRWWMIFLSRKTRKPFASFNRWLSEDCMGVCRSTVYKAILAATHLKELPPAALEELGHEKSYLLATLRRDSPTRYDSLLKTVLASPDLRVEDVKALVVNAMGNGDQSGGERWVSIEFLLRESDAQLVKQALAVQQAMQPAAQPDSEYALGVHLKAICSEFLTGSEAEKVWKKLDKAGAFSGSGFKLED